MSRRVLAVSGALVLAAALGGCGKVGQLERPGPLFGHAPNPVDAEAPAPRDPNRPVETVDPRDRSNDNLPTLPATSAPETAPEIPQ
jgi:hypothetical protein